MEKYRNEFQALTPKAQEMGSEFRELFKGFHDKWKDTFTRDELLVCVIDEAGLLIAEDALTKSMKQIKEKRNKK